LSGGAPAGRPHGTDREAGRANYERQRSNNVDFG